MDKLKFFGGWLKTVVEAIMDLWRQCPAILITIVVACCCCGYWSWTLHEQSEHDLNTQVIEFKHYVEEYNERLISLKEANELHSNQIKAIDIQLSDQKVKLDRVESTLNEIRTGLNIIQGQLTVAVPVLLDNNKENMKKSNTTARKGR